MRLHCILGAFLLCGASLAVPAAVGAAPPPAPTTVVHPTGHFPTDHEAVQAAVDGGGIVELQGVDADGEPTAFNFGPPEPGPTIGRVELTTDVTIRGARTGPPATITGGVIPFFGRHHTWTRIEGITFERPLLSAMIFVASAGAEIVDNRVVDIVGLELSFGPTEGRAIKFLGNNDPFGAISGHVLVEGNVTEDSDADFNESYVFDSVAASVTIRDNIAADAGGVLVIRPGDQVEITGNDIVPGRGTGSPDQFGNGIQLLGGPRTGTYVVTGNRIECLNPFADALLVVGSDLFGEPLRDARIERNRIHVESEFAGITLFSDVDGAIVANNQITGASLWALGVVPFFPGETADGVTLVGNNVSGHHDLLADTVVFSHARDTVLVGNGGTVLDLSPDASITGSAPIAGDPDVGRRMSEARSRAEAATAP